MTICNIVWVNLCTFLQVARSACRLMLSNLSQGSVDFQLKHGATDVGCGKGGCPVITGLIFLSRDKGCKAHAVRMHGQQFGGVADTGMKTDFRAAKSLI